MTGADSRPPVPIGTEVCVLPDITSGPVLAPLPAYQRFPWDPLSRGIGPGR